MKTLTLPAIAALFVQRDGAYFGIPGVDPWDEKRDARTYDGPYAVVAHPPCSRWCRLAGLVEKRWGYMRGDDGGCFASALDSVRRFGGVLEHPAYSDAWAFHDLTPPITGGGWTPADFLGGWTCYVEQGRYGHLAKKATWLYAKGIVLPSLRWGHVADQDVKAWVSWCGNKVRRSAHMPRLTSKQASATPTEFRDALIAMAQSVHLRREGAQRDIAKVIELE